MRVALVHDDLVQWGGAERVLEGLCEIYPEAPIFTSVFDRNNSELFRRFGQKKVITSILQKIPGWRSLYKALMPFYGLAFEQFSFDNFDLVISHTSRFAKAIITKPQTVHLCYCMTPPRFLWNFSGEDSFQWAKLLMDKLRVYDKVTSSRVDYFLANSQNTSQRIKKTYQREATVVYPFVNLERFTGVETFDGGYLVVVTRLNKYKRVDLAVKACGQLKIPLKVIGTGPVLASLQRYVDRHQYVNIDFLNNLDDEMVVQILAGCRVLIVPGIEDFGITPLEAQALGKPVLAYREGGVLETVIENKTGIFFDSQNVDSLSKAILKLNSKKINPWDCRSNAQKFSKENFIKNFQQTVASLL